MILDILMSFTKTILIIVLLMCRSFTGQSIKDRKNMPPPLHPRANLNKSAIVTPGAPMAGFNMSMTEDRE